jgi:hypothetical protein
MLDEFDNPCRGQLAAPAKLGEAELHLLVDDFAGQDLEQLVPVHISPPCPHAD